MLHLSACFYRTAILERCLRRLEFDKARDAEAKAQADQLEAERMAMQSIDWYAPVTTTGFAGCKQLSACSTYTHTCWLLFAILTVQPLLKVTMMCI